MIQNNNVNNACKSSFVHCRRLTSAELNLAVMRLYEVQEFLTISVIILHEIDRLNRFGINKVPL